MLKTILSIAVVASFTVEANAVTLRKVIRDCGDDGKRYCSKTSYGKPMQDCLSANYRKLTPACKSVIYKLRNGDRVTFF